MIIKNHRLNPIIQQTVVAADVSDLIVFQPDNAGLQPRPDHTVTVFAKVVDPGIRKPVLLRPLLELSILDPADSVDTRDPYRAIAPRDHVHHPLEKRFLAIGERVRS